MNEDARRLVELVSDKARSAPAQGSLAIHAGKVFTAAPAAQGMLRDQVVLVRDGRIAGLAEEREYAPEPGVEEIDARSKTVLPGLIEAHVHVTGEWVHAPHETHLEPYPETRVIRGLLDVWAVFTAGFTSLFSMGHGHPNYVSAIKTMIDKEGLPGPRLFHCGWAISQSAGHGNIRDWNYELVSTLRPRSAFADGEAAVRRLVRTNVGTGADFIKLYAGEGGYTAPDYIARRLDFSPGEIQAITDEAHRMGFRVAAHCMSLEHVRHALENGVDRIEHGPVGYEPDFVPMLAEHGGAWCPTLSQLHWALVEREQRGLSDATVARIEGALDGRCRMINEALAADVVVGFGTDNRMRPKAGRNAHELVLMAERGVAPADALRIATLGAARLTGLDDEAGSIEPGKVADLLVVDGDPLDDVGILGDPRAIATVVRSDVAALPKAWRAR